VLFWKAGVLRADALVENGDSRDVVGLVREWNAPSSGSCVFSTIRPLTRAFVVVEHAPPSLRHRNSWRSAQAQANLPEKRIEILAYRTSECLGPPLVERPIH